MTQPYCTTNPKFDAILREIGDLHDRKNTGYAVVDDPLHNFRQCEAFGIPMYQGIAVRISDKQSRWANLVADANKDKVGESLEETSIDEAIYQLLFVLALREYKALHFTDDAQELEEPGAEDFAQAQTDAHARSVAEDDGYVTDARDLSPIPSPEQQRLIDAGIAVAIVPRGPLSGDGFYGSHKRYRVGQEPT